MKQLEKILKAIGNKRRLAILSYLKKNNEATVGEIAGAIKLSFSATSRHLLILFNVDIVDKEQRSLEMYYSLSKKLERIASKIIEEL
ncbi:MAG TPA: metalloregulator ArsR/SmtB family transcription factor [Candidatus Paceibacterota bacterium]